MSYWEWKAQIFKKLFFIENGVIGMAAFFIGTFSGVGFSGVLVQIINHIFEMSHTYRISFSIKAFATLLYFLCSCTVSEYYVQQRLSADVKL